jgi:hypothetical protein
MILAFQILLFVFVLLFGLGSIGGMDKDMRLHCTCLTIASIGAICFSLWVV